MRLVKPSFEIMKIMGFTERFSDFPVVANEALELIEKAGRTCYKSEDKITETSSRTFAQNILKRGHESVIEHSAMTVKFVIDRGVSHELVRHRLCAFSQESTRYCNYKGGVTFVIPPWVNAIPGDYNQFLTGETESETHWLMAMLNLERIYKSLLEKNWSPQQARSVLPNSLKTEIVVTANFREWRHIFRLRCSEAAHPQMREIMIPLRDKARELVPIIFD